MARRKALDFFKGFTKTLARTAAVANVRREEKNLGQRLKTWSRLHMGHVPVDPRYDVSGLNTNKLKALDASVLLTQTLLQTMFLAK